MIQGFRSTLTELRREKMLWSLIDGLKYEVTNSEKETLGDRMQTDRRRLC